MRKLVAIMGPKGHGKSTAAQALLETGTFVPISFATPLKQACKIIFGLTTEEVEDPVLKETTLERWPFLSPRQILQHVGTDLFRNWLPPTWTNAAIREIRQAWADGYDVVIPDLRFLNEESVIHELNGLILAVNDPRKPAQDGGSHKSEIEQLSIRPHVRIINDGSINTLHAEVRVAVTDWFKDAEEVA